MCDCDNCSRVDQAIENTLVLVREKARERNAARFEAENQRKWARAWKKKALQLRRRLRAEAARDAQDRLALGLGEAGPKDEKLV